MGYGGHNLGRGRGQGGGACSHISVLDNVGRGREGGRRLQSFPFSRIRSPKILVGQLGGLTLLSPGRKTC